MAITTPTEIQITPSYQLALVSMAQEPIKRALENCNYLWRYHRPPLVSVCPTTDDAPTRSCTYHIPIIPSADALRYTFEHRIVCEMATQPVLVTVDQTTAYAGGATVWTNIYASGEVSSGTGGELNTWVHPGMTIPADAVALRVTYAAPPVGWRRDHHILVYPSPSDALAGIQPSGFVAFDDGMLAHADLAAVHTELINRCKESASAILRDRRQAAFSFVQEHPTPTRSQTNSTQWWLTPATRIWLPHQGPNVTLLFRAIASVSGGATDDLLRVAQLGVIGGKTVMLGAADTIAAASLVCQVQGTGLMRYVDVQFAYKTTAGNTTRPHAVVAYWVPGS